MSLDEFKADLARRLLQPHAVNSQGYEPVWFLVYDPCRVAEMNVFRHSLSKYLQTQGLTPVEFRVIDALWDIFESDIDWGDIKSLDDDELDPKELMATLKAVIEPSSNDNKLVERIKNALLVAKKEANPVLFVSGLEALHGLMRPGSTEAKLNGCFTCPTVFFYPGKTEGKAGLRFMNFHPVDANYHSEHLEVPEA